MWKIIVPIILLFSIGSTFAVSKGTVSRDSFLGSWSDVIEGIQTISNAPTKAKWEYRRDKLLLPKDTIDYGSSLISAFFTEMITDGLTGAGGVLTSGDIASRTTREGSRAQVLWGPKTIITLKDVSCALRSAGC